MGQKFRLNRSISHNFQDTSIFVFYNFCEKFKIAAIFGETNFFENWVYHSAYILWVKNFVEIALSHFISEINVFLHFTQKFKMAAKSGGENKICEK